MDLSFLLCRDGRQEYGKVSCERSPSKLRRGMAYLHGGEADEIRQEFRRLIRLGLTISNTLFQIANFESWSDEEVYAQLGRPRIEAVVRVIEPHQPQHTLSIKQISTMLLRLDGSFQTLGSLTIARLSSPKHHLPVESTCWQVVTPSLLPNNMPVDIWALGCTIYEARAGGETVSSCVPQWNPR